MWQSTRDLRVGIRAAFGHPVVRPIVIALMWVNASYGFFAALYTLLCLRTLGLSQAVFGVIVAMGGVGSLVGAHFARRIAKRFGIGPTILWSCVASVAMGVLIPIARGPAVLVIALLGLHQLVADGFAVVFGIHQVSLRQTVLPTGVLGRANAAIHAFSAGLVPFCAIAAGFIAHATSIRTAMWIGVILALVAPVALWPLRRVKALPGAETPSTDDQLRAS
jgi:predicted MFS family arabinose efflux permease